MKNIITVDFVILSLRVCRGRYAGDVHQRATRVRSIFFYINRLQPHLATIFSARSYTLKAWYLGERPKIYPLTIRYPLTAKLVSYVL